MSRWIHVKARREANIKKLKNIKHTHRVITRLKEREKEIEKHTHNASSFILIARKKSCWWMKRKEEAEERIKEERKLCERMEKN